MKLKFFSSLIALVFLFSACSDLFFDDSKNEVGNDFGTLTWSAADKSVAAKIDAVQNNTRNNASGPKITSNAHSADFPGIFFIWDSKQKDNGYLKVSATVFDKYESFVLTAKESNTYWDFPIALQEGQVMTSDGCYVFYIPKVYNNKNINMVFISEFKEKRTPECVYETVTVYFHPANGGIWNQYMESGSAIIGVPYNYCSDGCFDEWIKDFGPEDFWKDMPGFEGFLCTFDGWYMTDKDGVEQPIECLPVLGNEGVLIWAKHGENQCAVTPVDVTVTYNVNFLESFNKITHATDYATSGGGKVSLVNNGNSTMVPIPNSEGEMPVFDLGSGITGGYYPSPNSDAGNAFTGKTYIAIDVDALLAAGGSTDVYLGDEPQSNGPLPNQTWNPGDNYSYNVSIVNGELIVKINDYRSGSWDAILFKMDASRKNNIRSEATTANRTEKNLGAVSGTVYLFFVSNEITFNEIVGCHVVSTVGEFTRTYTGTVDDSIEVTCTAAAIVNGSVLTYDAEGSYTVTVSLMVNGTAVATKDVPVNVSLVGRRLVTNPVTVDFGDYIVGPGADEIICDVCQ